MSKLDVKHFLNIYRKRMQMQEKGITNPSDEIKVFTRTLVQKLSSMPLDTELRIENHSLIDNSGNIVIIFPTS